MAMGVSRRHCSGGVIVDVVAVVVTAVTSVPDGTDFVKKTAKSRTT